MAEEEPITVVGRIGCKVEAATDAAAAASAAAYTLSLAEPEEHSSPAHHVYTDAVRGFDCGESASSGVWADAEHATYDQNAAGGTTGERAHTPCTVHGVSARSAFSNASDCTKSAVEYTTSTCKYTPSSPGGIECAAASAAQNLESLEVSGGHVAMMLAAATDAAAAAVPCAYTVSLAEPVAAAAAEVQTHTEYTNSMLPPRFNNAERQSEVHYRLAEAGRDADPAHDPAAAESNIRYTSAGSSCDSPTSSDASSSSLQSMMSMTSNSMTSNSTSSSRRMDLAAEATMNIKYTLSNSNTITQGKKYMNSLSSSPALADGSEAVSEAPKPAVFVGMGVQYTPANAGGAKATMPDYVSAKARVKVTPAALRTSAHFTSHDAYAPRVTYTPAAGSDRRSTTDSTSAAADAQSTTRAPIPTTHAAAVAAAAPDTTLGEVGISLGGESVQLKGMVVKVRKASRTLAFLQLTVSHCGTEEGGVQPSASSSASAQNEDGGELVQVQGVLEHQEGWRNVCADGGRRLYIYIFIYHSIDDAPQHRRRPPFWPRREPSGARSQVPTMANHGTRLGV